MPRTLARLSSQPIGRTEGWRQSTMGAAMPPLPGRPLETSERRPDFFRLPKVGHGIWNRSMFGDGERRRLKGSANGEWTEGSGLSGRCRPEWVEGSGLSGRRRPLWVPEFGGSGRWKSGCWAPSGPDFMMIRSRRHSLWATRMVAPLSPPLVPRIAALQLRSDGGVAFLPEAAEVAGGLDGALGGGGEVEGGSSPEVVMARG